MLPSPWLVLRAGCPQPQGSLAQEQDAGGAMEASGCCGEAQLSLLCSLLQEDSPARAHGAVCGLWRVGEGPNVPQRVTPHLGHISGFECIQGHELHVFQLPVVQLGHPAQDVQVQRQVGQLLGHRESQRITPPSPGGPPHALIGDGGEQED